MRLPFIRAVTGALTVPRVHPGKAAVHPSPTAPVVHFAWVGDVYRDASGAAVAAAAFGKSVEGYHPALATAARGAAPQVRQWGNAVQSIDLAHMQSLALLSRWICASFKETTCRFVN